MPYKGKTNPIWNEANFYYLTYLKWVSACLAIRVCSQRMLSEPSEEPSVEPSEEPSEDALRALCLSGWEYMKSVVLLLAGVVCSVRGPHLLRISEVWLLGQTSMIIMLLCKSLLVAIVLLFVCILIIFVYSHSCKLNHLKCFLPSMSRAIQK